MKPNKTIEIKNCKSCDTFLLSVKGIMFKKRFSPHVFPVDCKQNFIFHTFMCPYFEVILLDNNCRVMKIIRDARKKMFFSTEHCSYVVELPMRTSVPRKIRVGDVVVLKYEKTEE